MPAQHPPQPLPDAPEAARLSPASAASPRVPFSAKALVSAPRPGHGLVELAHSQWAVQDHPAYLVLPPGPAPGLPLVIDLPHSHDQWPPGLATPAAASALGSVSDVYVDQFWLNACQGRVPLLLARFHRALIDPNRALTDLDPHQLSARWPGPLQPSIHSRRGVGLIRRWAQPGVPIWERPLTVAEVQRRIADFYEPYHQALGDLINQVQSRYGHCLHINAQAMKPVGDATNHDPGLPRPDFVVSNFNGLACAPALTCWVVDLLRSQGFEVWVNRDYMGAELIRRHAQPPLGRHALQIEINRALYMDEKTGQPGPFFNNLAPMLKAMIDGLAADPQRLADLCLPEAAAATEELGP